MSSSIRCALMTACVRLQSDRCRDDIRRPASPRLSRTKSDSRMRAACASFAARSSAPVRTVPSTSPAIRSSAEPSGNSNEIASTGRLRNPHRAAERRRPRRPRTGRTMGLPGCPWAEERPRRRRLQGWSRRTASVPGRPTSTARRVRLKRALAQAQAARSGSPMCWMTMLPTAASNDPSANCKRAAEAWTNCAAG